MIFSEWNAISLSRLMLGTVQFGIRYGVANQTGQPDYKDVVRIIKAAVEGGVNCFDTAAAYGTSEEVLGRAMEELRVAENIVVVTKVRALSPAELADRQLAEGAIEASVAESCRRLRLDCLPIVLFHRESDSAYMDVLARLRKKGLLQHFGVSCDNNPGNAAKYVEAGHASALQIPASVLDHRHLKSGVFKSAAEKSFAVFVRSVYLQGLLVMPEEKIPETLREVIPARQSLQRIAMGAGITLTELALRFMLSQPAVTSILTGVETVEQIADNLTMFSRGPLSDDVLAAIHLASIELSERILTPVLWSG